MKVAYFSPVNPCDSGISDYSEELLPELAEFFDLDLFVDGYEPSNREIRDSFPVVDAALFPDKRLERRYAVALYQMGNSHYHDYIYRSLLRYPGIVVLHDVVLHHLFLEMNSRRKNPLYYLREIAYSGGSEGIKAGLAILQGVQQPELFDLPLIGRVVSASLATIVHNRYARDIVETQTGQSAHVIPQHVKPPAPVSISERIALRQSMGIRSDSVVFGAFGHATPTKRLDVVLRVFQRLKALLPEIYLLIVGRQSPDGWLSSIVEELGLGDSVVITGSVPMDRFLAAMSVSDVCVNLRYPTAGETSASLLRIMAAGIPAIVSDVGWFSELPDDCCFKIPINSSEESLLFRAMRDLAVSDFRAVAMGARARAYVQSEHSIQRTVRSYLDIVGEVHGAPTRRHQETSTNVTTTASDSTFLAASHRELAHLQTGTALRREVQAALGELGLA